jgi:hypothetical protein
MGEMQKMDKQKFVKMFIPFILPPKNKNKNGFVRYAPSIRKLILFIVL